MAAGAARRATPRHSAPLRRPRCATLASPLLFSLCSSFLSISRARSLFLLLLLPASPPLRRACSHSAVTAPSFFYATTIASRRESSRLCSSRGTFVSSFSFQRFSLSLSHRWPFVSYRGRSAADGPTRGRGGGGGGGFSCPPRPFSGVRPAFFL